jgi:hypothetical protein
VLRSTGAGAFVTAAGVGLGIGVGVGVGEDATPPKIRLKKLGDSFAAAPFRFMKAMISSGRLIALA